MSPRPDLEARACGPFNDGQTINGEISCRPRETANKKVERDAEGEMMKADKKRQYRGGETGAAEGDITRRGWDEWPGNAVVVETRREGRERR